MYVQEKFGGTVYVREKLAFVSRPSQPLAAGAVVHRDLKGLRAEVEFERIIARNNAGGRTVKSAASPAQQPQAAIGGS